MDDSLIELPFMYLHVASLSSAVKWYTGTLDVHTEVMHVMEDMKWYGTACMCYGLLYYARVCVQGFVAGWNREWEDQLKKLRESS